MAALHSSSTSAALHLTTDSNVQKQSPRRPSMEGSRGFWSNLRPKTARLQWSIRNSNKVSASWETKVSVGEAEIAAGPAAPEMVSEMGVSYEALQKLLEAGEFEKADEETRRLIIVLAGESAVKRKYVFFSEVQFMPAADLATIDRLWRAYSQGKFGYSVQRKIMKRADGDCTVFFQKVGWMKPLGDDSPQFTYRAFPGEFTWELGASTPDGHLPLTNALRGTQLLKALLFHPAFDFADDELQAPSTTTLPPSLSSSSSSSSSSSNSQSQKKPLSINYSF